MSEFDRDLNPKCCPYEDRSRAKTVNGKPVSDLHDHKGLLRGMISEEGSYGAKPRVMFWLSSGRLSTRGESPFDLRNPIG